MIQVIETVGALREALGQGKSVGLVPTMGYLHEGHATLIRRAAAENEVVVVSDFVNPRQFGPKEDLSRYPRDLPRDLEVAGGAGAQVLFHPPVTEMYPQGYCTNVSVTGSVSGAPEGTARPGHFDGVATVVLKLLNIVRPDRAYFGEKDWQQLAVIRRLVADLNVAVQIVGVPIVRAESGLALSSRNSYLTDEQRQRATVLSRALAAVQQAAAQGERDASRLRQIGLDVLAQEPEAAVEYLLIVDNDMQEIQTLGNQSQGRIVVAARMFGVRLIDNGPLFEENDA